MIVQRGMLTALDMKQGTAGRGAGDRLVKFIRTKALSDFVEGEIADLITNPIIFRAPNGSIAYGYRRSLHFFWDYLSGACGDKSEAAIDKH